MELVSAKTVPTAAAPLNVLWNAAFHSYDAAARSLAGWKLPGTNWEIEVLPDSEALYADQRLHQAQGRRGLRVGGALVAHAHQPRLGLVDRGVQERLEVACPGLAAPSVSPPRPHSQGSPGSNRREC